MNSSIAFVYIAGPFSPTKAQRAALLEAAGGDTLSKEQHRACVEENIRRATALGVKVSRLGAMPVIPHAMTSDPEFEETQGYEFWIKATKELLSRCDAALFTDDWRESSGARGENEHAIDLGIARFFSLPDLASWLLPAVNRLNVEPSPVLDTADTERTRPINLPPSTSPSLANLARECGSVPAGFDDEPALLDVPVDLDDTPVCGVSP